MADNSNVLNLSIASEKEPALTEREFETDSVIVKLRPTTNAQIVNALQDKLNVSEVEETQTLGLELWEINNISVEEAIDTYSEDPAIEYIEPNYEVSINDLPDDPRFDELWGLNNTGQTGGVDDADIDASEAWDIETGNDVVIGVIDTGIDYTHPDLDDNVWVNEGEIPDNGIDDDSNGYVDDYHGYDFVNDDGDPFDDAGHGTHVSGTIAAEGDNSVGVTGVNWNAQIMGLKFLDEFGSGDTFGAIQAVEYATLMGADLTNNSWGGGGFSQALEDAIAAAGEQGQIFVAAAGNDSSDTDIFAHYPSSYDLDNIISVAATTDSDLLAGFSNHGATSVDLSAPGQDILSTTPNNSYSYFNGTSMASPHVAGVVSLLLSQSPGLSHQEVKERILETVDLIPALEGITVSAGRLNAFNALLSDEAGAIEGSKWNDLDRDGVKDESEPGLADWTIYLDNNQNGEIDEDEPSRITDADGNYAFSFLEPGNYSVAEVLQPGWSQTFPDDTHDVTVTEGETISNLNFGNFLSDPATISGVKWHDLDRDGVKDEGEPGLADWTIYLDDNQNGELDEGELSTVTNATGQYSLSDLEPGVYTVAEVVQPGWSQTFPEEILPREIVLDETNDTITQAIATELSTANPGTVNSSSFIGDNPNIDPEADVDLAQFQLDEGDRVTLDIDASELGSSLDSVLRLFDSEGTEVAVSDDDPAPGEDFTLDSYIDFTATTSDTYYVGVSSYDNFTYDPFNEGSGTGFSSGDYDLEIAVGGELLPGVYRVDVAPGETAENLNFGNFELEPGSISGSKWNDLNGDGERNETEPGLADWTIYLDDNQNGELDEDELFEVTDADGNYTFSDLPATTYTVAEVLQDGWQQTFPGGSSSSLQDILLFDDDAEENHFQTALDNLGLDYQVFAEEEAFNSAVANAETSNTLVIIDSVAGFHNFSTTVDFVDNGGRGILQYWDLDSDPTLAEAFDATVAADIFTPEPIYDWGNTELFAELSNPVSLIETFWDDDGDRLEPLADSIASGGYVPDETANQAAQIVGNTGKTIVNGFLLDNASVDADSVQLATNAIEYLASSNTYTVDLPAGEAVTDLDFGNQEILPGEIRGSKWNDLNGNGERDEGEPGIENWTIYLDDNQNGELDEGEISTTTDTNGEYVFTDVEPGSYTVTEVVEEGWQPTFPVAFEYESTDSNQPEGPVFDWVDISDVGTELNLFDDDFAEVELPFTFPFFEQEKTDVKISSNGYLSFGSEATDYTNDPIPDSEQPNDIIAPFWDDLNPSDGGNIYYYYDETDEQFIVQYQDIPRFEDSGSLTFQTILEADGSILHQYDNMNGTLDSATIGVENVDGSGGLEVAFNEAYVEDELAVSIEPVAGSLQPYNITVDSGEVVTDLDFGNLDTEPEPEPEPPTIIIGTLGDDEIIVTNGSTTVLALGGDDFVDASSSSGNNELYGQLGQDELIASTSDRLFGGNQNDFLDASQGSGNNELFAGRGNDILLAGREDRLFGRNGDDLLFASDTGVLSLASDLGNLLSEAQNQAVSSLVEQRSENLATSTVEPGNNLLDGGLGNDLLFAGHGDRLFGRNGDDLLFVSDGDNRLTGGLGADQFWIATGALPSSTNTVADFRIDTDVLGIGGLELTFDDLSIVQQGQNTLISALDTDIAILEGIQADDIDSSSFVFV